MLQLQQQQQQQQWALQQLQQQDRLQSGQQDQFGNVLSQTGLITDQLLSGVTPSLLGTGLTDSSLLLQNSSLFLPQQFNQYSFNGVFLWVNTN